MKGDHESGVAERLVVRPCRPREVGEGPIRAFDAHNDLREVDRPATVPPAAQHRRGDRGHRDGAGIGEQEVRDAAHEADLVEVGAAPSVVGRHDQLGRSRQSLPDAARDERVRGKHRGSEVARHSQGTRCTPDRLILQVTRAGGDSIKPNRSAVKGSIAEIRPSADRLARGAARPPPTADDRRTIGPDQARQRIGLYSATDVQVPYPAV